MATEPTLTEQHAEKIDEIAYWAWQAVGRGLFDDAVRRAENDSATARQVTAARSVARSALIAAGRMPAWPEGEFERIAKSQAETLGEQAASIRELIRERDAARGKAEGAYDLAGQYAHQAGVDVSRDDTLRYVDQYWEQRGALEKTWEELEGLRWEVLQLIFDLREGLANDGVDAHTGRQVAENVVLWLGRLAGMGGDKKRLVVKYARPEPPGLFPEAAR